MGTGDRCGRELPHSSLTCGKQPAAHTQPSRDSPRLSADTGRTYQFIESRHRDQIRLFQLKLLKHRGQRRRNGACHQPPPCIKGRCYQANLTLCPPMSVMDLIFVSVSDANRVHMTPTKAADSRTRNLRAQPFVPATPCRGLRPAQPGRGRHPAPRGPPSYHFGAIQAASSPRSITRCQPAGAAGSLLPMPASHSRALPAACLLTISDKLTRDRHLAEVSSPRRAVTP